MKSPLTRIRLWLWGGAAISIALSAVTSKTGVGWLVALFMLTFIGLLDWFLIRKQMHIGKAFATVDASGISSPAVKSRLFVDLFNKQFRPFGLPVLQCLNG